MWFYYLIFLFLLFFHFFFNKKSSNKQVGYFLCLLLIIIAAFRPPGIDRDYYNYKNMFEDLSILGGSSIEYSYQVITKTIKIFTNNFIYVLLFYALFGIGLKYIAIRELSEYWILSLLVYFGYFYICYDMTQIREGLAMAIFLLSIPDIKERRINPFLLKFIIAFFIHYSAIIMFPIFFVIRPKYKSFLPYLFILFLSIISLVFANNKLLLIIKLFPISGIQKKLEFYINLQKKDIFNTINIFTIARILRISIIMILIFYVKAIEQYNQYVRTLLQIYIISLSVFFFLVGLPPVFSYRLSEFLGIVEIIIFPLLAYIIKPKLIGEIVVVFIALIFLLYNLLIHQYIQPYFNT